MSDNILSLNGVCKSHDGRPLLQNLGFGVDAGDKVGLIGRNGAGKSTLLRIIAGVDAPDDGQVALRSGIRVAILEQIPTFPTGWTVQRVLEGAVGELRQCIARYEEAAQNMSEDAEDLLERIQQLGGWDYQHRIETAANRLGLVDLDAKVDHLSGGERKRIALARLVLEEPDLVLFDEPTNHLDADTVEWMERWLQRSQSTCVLVTHDRYFLDQVVDRIVELRDGATRTYPGNYADYLAARAIEEAQRERTHHRRLRLLLGELEWARRAPKARTTKARARLERIDSVEDEVERLTGERFEPDFRFGKAARLGKTILEVEDLHLAHGDGPLLCNNLTLALRKGERIGVLGPNGCGKTTLLEVLCGDQKARSGRVRRGVNTRIAYFDQHRAALDGDSTVRDIVAPDGGGVVFPGGGRAVNVAAWLDRFGFATPTHTRTVSTLSGGERNRLAIARFLLQEANLLLLDEPTNDLDIPTLTTLEEAIAGFDGCVVVVSHDRYLLDKVATGILAFEGEYLGPGAVRFEQGNYTSYHDRRLVTLQQQQQREERERAGARREQKAAQQQRKEPTRRTLTYAERKELAGLEPAIEAAEAKVAELEAELAAPDLWSAGAERGQTLRAALDQAQAEATRLFARWEELMTRLQEAGESGP